MSLNKNKHSFLFVHSKDRDLVQYPSPSRYRIDIADKIGTPFTKIKSISLFSAILPNINSILSEPYLLLKIEELTGPTFAGTNSTSQQAFALLMLDKSYDAKFFNARHEMFREMPECTTRSLGMMTISLTDQYGALFDFGNDLNGVVNNDNQHTLVFKITQDVPPDANVLF